MKITKEWFKFQIYRRQARAWLAANDERIVARSMFYLNRHIRGWGWHHLKNLVYGLKTKLIKDFYETGFCESLTEQTQTLYCHTCGGTGWFRDDVECYRCWNGIYAKHTLYQFVFRVYGKTYIWHQPKSLVHWPVELTSEEAGTYEGKGQRYHRDLSQDLLYLHLAVVYEYLRVKKVQDLPGLPTLRLAVRGDWRNSRLYRKWMRFKSWRWRIKRQWKRRNAPELSEDEIPF